MTRHQANAFVRELKLGIDCRQPFDGRGATNDDLGAPKRFKAFLGQLDAVPLPPQVQVAVIRLFDRDPWYRR
ncbi:hypothetical protein D3C77_726330 [compost metagenome]